MHGSADDEAAVGDVVELADRPFLLPVVDEERPDLEGGRLFGLVVRGGLGWRIRHLADGPEGDNMDFGRGCR